MTIKSKSLFFISAFTILGCAKFVPPTGGDKDITPPKLIESSPNNKEVNFKGQQIRLLFDELVDSKTLKQELIITPESKGRYKVKNRGEEIQLDFEENFQDSTTYTLSFGSGIKDMNEQNKADNLKLVFSTGSELDSLRIQGSITNLFTKEGILGATLGMYKLSTSDTLPLLQRKPDYFTKSDSSGNFQLENLKSDTYRILAFTDKNGNQKFDNKKELFGFVKDTIKLNINIENISVELFPYDTIAPKYKRYIQKENTYALKFDEPIYKTSIVFDDKKDSIPYINIADEIRFFNTGNLKDSISVSIVVSDSLLNSDTLSHKITFREGIQKKKETEETLKITVNPKSKSPVTPKEPYLLSFEYPLIKIDSSKISISDDTLKSVRFTTRILDSSKTKVEIDIQDVITQSVVIDAEKGAFINFLADSSSSFILTNPILKSTDLGLIAGTIEKVDSLAYSYIVQLLKANDTKLVEEQISQTGEYLFKDIRPDDYLIRVIVDQNNNGVWDSANFSTSTFPERVLLLKEPIRVKANFEFRDINITNQ